ncbi:Vicilin Cor a 11.0101 [Linum perenne]
MRAGIAVVILFVQVLCSGLALATKDLEELRQCQDECKQRRQFSEKQKVACIQKCEVAVREKGKERGSKVSEEELGEDGENPYIFKDEHFLSEYETQHGKILILQRFTEKSELLQGIDQYRIGVIEIDPQAFISPCHVDADDVLYVAQGRGTFTIIQEDRGRITKTSRRSFHIETGDLVRLHAGTPAYVVNKDDNQKLVIIKLIRPINLQGSFEVFFGPGGDNPESFFRAFSPELLEAAFKVDRERLQRIFQNQEGVIMKASREQIQALSHGDEAGRCHGWLHSGESSNPFSLLRKRPTLSNNYGQLFDVDPNEFEQLRDLNLMITFANITQGAMAGPFYNSKAMKIAYVVEGEGYLEMACPHISPSSSSHGSGQMTYGKVRSQLNKGTVFVVPTGHPVAMVASRHESLQIVCFAVNGQGNFKFSLAGKNNVMSEMEREALELGFGDPGREVEEIFGNQNEDFYFPGPEMQQ